MKLNKLLMVALIIYSAAMPVHAEINKDDSATNPFSISGSLTFLTDYYWRGVSQTKGNPALQGILRLDHESGLYAQAFASNIDLEISSSLELDYYIGYNYLLNDYSKINIQYLDVNYPGADKSLPNVNFEEYSFSIINNQILKSNDELNFSIYYSPEYSMQTGTMLRYELGYIYPINNYWNIVAQLAYNQFSSKTAYDLLWGTDRKDGFYDYKLGGNLTFQGLIFDLYYASSNVNKELPEADPTLVFSLTKNF